MTVLERIKQLCKENNMSLTTLEQKLGYSNGSLAKAKDIPSSRISEISKCFGVTMDFLMTGKESEFSIEIAKTDVELSNMEKRIKTYALKLNQLPKNKQESILNLIDMLEKE